MNRMTNTTENITFQFPSEAGGNDGSLMASGDFRTWYTGIHVGLNIISIAGNGFYCPVLM